MTQKENTVKYVCEECKQKFDAPQGSRRKYCVKCALKRIYHDTKTT